MNKSEWINKWESVMKYCDECQILIDYGYLEKTIRKQVKEYGLYTSEEDLKTVIDICRIGVIETILDLENKYNSGEYLSINEDIININEVEQTLKDLVDMLNK